MTAPWPAPPPAPQPGGPHPREWVALIREARTWGFTRIHPSLTGAVSVWSDGMWRVEVEPLKTVAEVRILRRSKTRFECFDQVAEFWVSSPDQLHAALIVFRVLPSPIGEAA